MPFDFHIFEAPDGGQPLYNDRIVIAQRNNVANASGSTSVATDVSFPDFALPVDSTGNPLYCVHVTPNQNATVASATKPTTASSSRCSPRRLRLAALTFWSRHE